MIQRTKRVVDKKKSPLQIIEMFGVSGGGKSTIARMTVNRNKSLKNNACTEYDIKGAWEFDQFVYRQIDATWVIKGLCAFNAIIKRPRISCELLINICRDRALTFGVVKDYFRLMNSMEQQSSLYELANGASVIIEEGMLQMVGPMSRYGCWAKEKSLCFLLDVLQNICLDGAIWVDCPQDEAHRRRIARCNSLGAMNVESVNCAKFNEQKYANRSDIYALVADCICKNGLPLLRLDATVSLLENTDRISEWLGQISCSGGK